MSQGPAATRELMAARPRARKLDREDMFENAQGMSTEEEAPEDDQEQ